MKRVGRLPASPCIAACNFWQASLVPRIDSFHIIDWLDLVLHEFALEIIEFNSKDGLHDYCQYKSFQFR